MDIVSSYLALPTIPTSLPWDATVTNTAVVSGTYEELLLFTVVPLFMLYNLFATAASWAEWPMILVDKYTLGLVLPLISYASTWMTKGFELMVIYPLAWLRW